MGAGASNSEITASQTQDTRMAALVPEYSCAANGEEEQYWNSVQRQPGASGNRDCSAIRGLQEYAPSLLNAATFMKDVAQQVSLAVEENSQLERKLSQMEEDNKRLHRELAKFSDKRMQEQDQSRTENIGSRNRPSKVEENYLNFFSHERLDAVFEMEKHWKGSSSYPAVNGDQVDVHNRRLACVIFELTYEQAQKAIDGFKRACPYIFHSASQIGMKFIEAENNRRGSGTETKLELQIHCSDVTQPRALTNSLKAELSVMLRETSLENDVSLIVKAVELTLKEGKEKGKYRLKEYDDRLFQRLKKFMEKCAKLAWNMVTLTPPLHIGGHKRGTIVHFDPCIHSKCKDLGPTDLQENSSQEILHVLWPALLDSTGTVLVRAEVILKASNRR